MDEVVRERGGDAQRAAGGRGGRAVRGGRYERTAERTDTRAGHYTRKLQTKAGEVTLKVPRLRIAAVRDADHRAVPAAGVAASRRR